MDSVGNTKSELRTCGMCGAEFDIADVLDFSNHDTGYEMYACLDCVNIDYGDIMSDGGRV